METHGLVGADRSAVDLPAIGIDAAGTIQREDKWAPRAPQTRWLGCIVQHGWRDGLAFVNDAIDRAQNTRWHAAQGQAQADAKDGVDDHIGAVDQAAQQTQIAIVARGGDKEAVFPRARQELLVFSPLADEIESQLRRAGPRQITRHDQAIAAVVAFADEENDGRFGVERDRFAKALAGSRSRVLHHLGVCQERGVSFRFNVPRFRHREQLHAPASGRGLSPAAPNLEARFCMGMMAARRVRRWRLLPAFRLERALYRSCRHRAEGV